MCLVHSRLKKYRKGSTSECFPLNFLGAALVPGKGRSATPCVAMFIVVFVGLGDEVFDGV